MPILVACPQCGHESRAKKGTIGKKGRCPKCKQVITILGRDVESLATQILCEGNFPREQLNLLPPEPAKPFAATAPQPPAQPEFVPQSNETTETTSVNGDLPQIICRTESSVGQQVGPLGVAVGVCICLLLCVIAWFAIKSHNTPTTPKEPLPPVAAPRTNDDHQKDKLARELADAKDRLRRLEEVQKGDRVKQEQLRRDVASQMIRELLVKFNKEMALLTDLHADTRTRISQQDIEAMSGVAKLGLLIEDCYKQPEVATYLKKRADYIKQHTGKMLEFIEQTRSNFRDAVNGCPEDLQASFFNQIDAELNRLAVAVRTPFTNEQVAYRQALVNLEIETIQRKKTRKTNSDIALRGIEDLALTNARDEFKTAYLTRLLVVMKGIHATYVGGNLDKDTVRKSLLNWGKETIEDVDRLVERFGDWIPHYNDTQHDVTIREAWAVFQTLAVEARKEIAKLPGVKKFRD